MLPVIQVCVHFIAYQFISVTYLTISQLFLQITVCYYYDSYCQNPENPPFPNKRESVTRKNLFYFLQTYVGHCRYIHAGPALANAPPCKEYFTVLHQRVHTAHAAAELKTQLLCLSKILKILTDLPSVGWYPQSLVVVKTTCHIGISHSICRGGHSNGGSCQHLGH